MKREIILVVGLTLVIASVLGIVVSAHGPRGAAVSANQMTDAAFRDGLFQAKLEIQSGKAPHLASGRWSTYSDRAQFIAGYQQGYREFSDAHPGKLPTATAAQLAGYSDGLSDGAMHRRASQPFQVYNTDNYRDASPKNPAAHPDVEQYKQNYRRAYPDGYQQGYYAQPDQQELKTVGQTSASF